jgi:hypothetical protein
MISNRRALGAITKALDYVAFFKSQETKNLSFTIPDGVFGGKNPLYSCWSDRKNKIPPIGEVVAAFTYSASDFKSFSPDVASLIVRRNFREGNMSMVVTRGDRVYLLIAKPDRYYISNDPNGMRFGFAARLIADPE